MIMQIRMERWKMNRFSVISILALTLMSLVLSSCLGMDEPVGVTPSVTEYPVTVSASSGVDSRISADGLSLAWERDDTLKISAVAADATIGTSDLTVYQIDEENPREASFTGFVSMLQTPQYCNFMYPATMATSTDPATGRIKFQYNSQTGRHEPFLYARAAYDPDGMAVSMKHAGAVLEITVDIPDISTITFAGNRLENLYPMEIDPETGNTFFSSEIGMQITVPVQKEGKTYICVPPVNLPQGFSLICSKSDNTSMIKTFSSDGTLTGGYDFSSKVGSIIPVTLDGPYEKFDVSVSDIAGTHTRNNQLLTGTAVTFRVSKTGSSNKIIEEWGARLLNSEGEQVRSVLFTNQNPISGQTVIMEVDNNWRLLPAGQYTLMPYYKIYGQTVTLGSKPLEISDPEIWVRINGQTSYDKYKANDITGANSHSSSIIEGVSVSTNLDASLISWSAVFDGTNLTNAYPTSSATEHNLSFGNISRTEYGAYEFNVSISVPNLEPFTASRVFHITGLPYEIDFAAGRPTDWGELGIVEYSDSRYTYKNAGLSNKDGAVVSPAFKSPQNDVKVKVYADVCRKNKENLYVKTCAEGASSISYGSAYVEPHSISLVGSLAAKGYKECNAIFTLTDAEPALMFAAKTSWSNHIGLYKIKIEYN